MTSVRIVNVDVRIEVTEKELEPQLDQEQRSGQHGQDEVDRGVYSDRKVSIEVEQALAS